MPQSATLKTAEGAIELDKEAVSEIPGVLRQLLADVFTLYLKTKNFHWHISSRHFRDYHLLLDQAGRAFKMSNDIAERARKIGGSTLRSIGDIAGISGPKIMTAITSGLARCDRSFGMTTYS
jgi:starvation-inducible DNA-binding protein